MSAHSPHPPDAADVFAILVREHAERLSIYLRASVPASAVDDLFQESVLIAWRRLGDYDRARPFGPWLRGIARNLVLDFRSKRLREVATDSALLDGIDRRADELDRVPPEELRQRLTALEDCVGALPEDYRTVIHLAYRTDSSLASVASQVGANVEAVKKRLQRARAMLATCLQDKGTFA